MKTTLQYSTLEKVVPFIARFMQRLERWTKPRYKWLATSPLNISLIGFAIVSGGFFLALPLPIPLTNAPPAISIIFLIVGMLCRDGIIVLVGHILGILAWAYLALWLILGQTYLIPMLHHWWEVIKS